MVTRFGTTKEMIIQPVEENNNTLLLAIDSRGLYLTQDKYLDKNLADPNRYAARAEVEARLTALGLNYKELFESNKHLIQAIVSTAKKVNPLKASKRSMGK